VFIRDCLTFRQLVGELLREKLHEEHEFEFSDFFKGPVIVSEKASFTVWAKELLLEGGASLRLVFRVDGSYLAHEFLITMSELALGSIAALAYLDPVLAHLCFVLRLIRLLVGSIALVALFAAIVLGTDVLGLRSILLIQGLLVLHLT